MESTQNILEKYFAGKIGLADNLVFNYGKFVAKYPWVFILLTLLIAALGGSGATAHTPFFIM